MNTHCVYMDTTGNINAVFFIDVQSEIYSVTFHRYLVAGDATPAEPLSISETGLQVCLESRHRVLFVFTLSCKVVVHHVVKRPCAQVGGVDQLRWSLSF